MAEIGSTIPRNNPRYQILKKIGQGGMSEVYLANDLQMDMMVAVKEVRTDIEYDKNGRKIDLNAYIQGLENECDLLKSVDHPVLPRTLSIDRGQKIYVIMDYIDGEDMSKILKREGKLSQDQVLECALQVCDALRYLQAHNPPIIYRDLKPSNIMWKKDGGFKLIDFGTAIEFRPGQKYYNMGTKGFGAPEQLRRQNPVADQRSDIYSLGATMYCLLSGKTPSVELMQEHPVREFNPTVSIGLENVIKRCVDPDPNNRYQSAAELLYALEHYDEEDASFKKKQRGKLNLFIATVVLAGVMLVAGAGLLIAKTELNDQNYEALVQQKTVESCQAAIELQPANPKAYMALLDLYEEDGFSKEAEGVINGTLLTADGMAMEHNRDYIELCSKIGDMYFYAYDYGDDPDLSEKLKKATVWYEKVVKAVDEEGVKDYDTEMYKMAKNFCNMNEFFVKYLNSGKTAAGVNEASASSVQDLFKTMSACVENAKNLKNAYMKVVTGDAVCYMLNTTATNMSDAGISQNEVLGLLDQAYQMVVAEDGANQSITKEIINDLKVSYAGYYANITRAYNDKTIRDEIKQQKTGQEVTP